jgi:hypothetical protein
MGIIVALTIAVLVHDRHDKAGWGMAVCAAALYGVFRLNHWLIRKAHESAARRKWDDFDQMRGWWEARSRAHHRAD